MIKRINQLKQGDILYCSVCGKPFKLGPEHKYIINGGYSCSWECFLNASKPKIETTSVINSEGLIEDTKKDIIVEDKPAPKKRGRKNK